MVGVKISSLFHKPDQECLTARYYHLIACMFLVLHKCLCTRLSTETEVVIRVVNAWFVQALSFGICFIDMISVL